MEKLKLFVTGCSLILVAGCAGQGVGVPGSLAWQWSSSEDHIAAYYRTACRELGFETGTEAFNDCLISRPRRPGQVSNFGASLDRTFDNIQRANDEAYQRAVERNQRAFDRAWERQPRWNPSKSRYE